MQRAIEDGFKASGFNGAAVDARSRQRRGARVHEPARRTTRTRLRPASIAPTWAALNTDELRPLQDRAIQGRYSPGSTFKMAVAAAALEEGRDHARLQGALRGAATFYGRSFKCWKARRARHGRSAPRDRAVVQRVLLHGREHDRHRPDPQVGDASRPRREERHRSAERSAGPRAVDRVEAAAVRREMVSRAKRFRCRSARARCR